MTPVGLKITPRRKEKERKRAKEEKKGNGHTHNFYVANFGTQSNDSQRVGSDVSTKSRFQKSWKKYSNNSNEISSPNLRHKLPSDHKPFRIKPP